MYKMSLDQEVQMDKKLVIAASSYAECLRDELSDALVTQNRNLLLVEEEDDEKVTTFFYEKASYVHAGILEFAQEVTGLEDLTTYEQFADDLITFEQYVSYELEDDWYFTYGDNGDCIAVKRERIPSFASLV